MDTATIISLICCVVSAVIGPVTVLLVKHELEKKAKLEEEEEKKHREERREDVLTNVAIVIKPLEDKVDGITKVLEQDKQATVTNIRSTLKALRDKYKEQGYADIGDKATWLELYNNYKAMGGNHFREYVDA